MKNFFQYLSKLSNKSKSIYALWFFINLIILLISGNGLTEFDREFYPFSRYGYLLFDPRIYDYSEFFIYILTPIFFLLIIFFWRKK
jgi:hypothetical protein